MAVYKETELTEYSRMIDDYAWYNKGNIFEIAKTAQLLGRNYMEDITNRKMAMIPAMKKSM